MIQASKTSGLDVFCPEGDTYNHKVLLQGNGWSK